MCGLLIFALSLLWIPADPCPAAAAASLRLGYGTTILPAALPADLEPLAEIDARNAWLWTEDGALSAGIEGIVRHDAEFAPIAQLSELSGPTSFSPDGAYAAVAAVAPDSWPPQTERDIAIVPLDGGVPVQFERAERLGVGSSSAHRVGSWSPDGRWLLVRRIAYLDGEAGGQVALSVEGTITPLPGQSAFGWRWLSDSTLLRRVDGAVEIKSPQGQPLRRLALPKADADLMVTAPRGLSALVRAGDGWRLLDLVTGELTLIEGPASEHRVSWSPDGSHAVLHSPGSPLYVYDVSRRELRELSGIAAVSTSALRGIAWSPDNERFVALLSEDEAWWRYRKAWVVEVETLRVVGINLRGLRSPGCGGGPTWSNDGSMFALAARPGREGALTQLRIYQSSGQLVRRLALDRFGQAMETRLSWSPDGRWLAVGHYPSTCP